MKYKITLYATKKDDNKLESVREEIMDTDSVELFLLPSPSIFAEDTSLSISLKLLDSQTNTEKEEKDEL